MKPIPKHTLSKSTFTYGCQCLKRLYLHKFRSELANPEDEQQAAIFQAGTDTGKLAQQLFPGGVDASPPDPFSYQQSVKDTKGYLKTHDVIYEAAFQYDGVMCAVDILVREGNKWHAYEVKSTNSVKEQHRLDAALQYYVLKNSGLSLRDFSVVTFNRDYVRIGELDVQKLFVTHSVKQYCKEETAFVGTKIWELKLMLEERIEPVVEPGDFCFKPYECNFTQHCWADVEEEEEEEIEDNEPVIDKAAIKSFIEQVEYPLYHLDFETVMYGVPEFDYSSPYQQIPFQFSIHMQQNAKAEVEHYAYLGDGQNDPREELIKELIRIIGAKGTVFGWNIIFEKARLQEMARNFPKYKKQLMAIHDRMIDLMKPFKSKAYMHPGFRGSASLKNVLPIMAPELSYQNLEIQEGGTASFIYSQLKHMDKKTAALNRTNLLDYCHLDTLAMVRIWEKLNEAIK